VDIGYVLTKMVPNAEFSANETYESIEWYSKDIEKPSLEECEAFWASNKNDYAFNVIRAIRNILLKESDWTQTPDAPVDSEAWAEYRQALRDLPENTIDPENPVWPTPPNN
jgi:hypothetical protein